jgi:hypothetical protein
MHYKADRVKALLEQVLQPIGSLSFEEVMMVKSYVVGEMDHPFHDLLHCQCALNKLRREQ